MNGKTENLSREIETIKNHKEILELIQSLKQKSHWMDLMQ